LLDIFGDRSHLPRLNAWATSTQGYKNLLKIASTGWSNKVEVDDKASYPVVSCDELKMLKEGIVIGSGCDKGLFAKDSVPLSYEDAAKCVSIFNGKDIDLICEFLAYDVHAKFDSNAGFKGIPNSAQTPGGNLTQAINNLAMRCVEDMDLKFIVSSAAHFIKPEDKLLQDVVSRSAFKDGRYFYESRHQRSTAEMCTILSRHMPNSWSMDLLSSAINTANNIVDESKSIEVDYS
jgi:DNA polymerase III alpha subunit